MSKLSALLIEMVLSNSIKAKNVKTKDGNLLIEIGQINQSNKIKKNKFCDISVKVPSPHKRLNPSKGIISREEMLNELINQGVIES